MRCAQCRAVNADALGDTCVCRQCGATLHVRKHFSRRLAAWLGVPVARDAGDLAPSPGFSNSAEALRRFPFPFRTGRFAYGVNIEPHERGAAGSVFANAFDLDEHYLREIRDRERILLGDPLRCQVLPHLLQAQWEALALLMHEQARAYPQHFSLDCVAAAWRWRNRLLAIDREFTFGDSATLPQPPLEFITRQVQGDFCLIDQRDGELWLDGGMVTSPADWSLDFDLGMNFIEWHRPVPLPAGSRVFERAHRFLLSLQTGAPVRRLNWSITVGPRLDTSPETFAEWGGDRERVTAQNAGDLVHLRVELQSLWRLPESNAILFSIRTYLASLAQLVTLPGRAASMAAVLRSLPPEVIEYKGLARYHATMIDWLDGR